MEFQTIFQSKLVLSVPLCYKRCRWASFCFRSDKCRLDFYLTTKFSMKCCFYVSPLSVQQGRNRKLIISNFHMEQTYFIISRRAATYQSLTEYDCGKNLTCNFQIFPVWSNKTHFEPTMCSTVQNLYFKDKISNFWGYQEPIATAEPNWNSTLSKQFLIFTQITFIRLLSVLFDLTDTLYTIRHGWRQSCNEYSYIDFISSVYRIVYYMSKHVSKCWQKNYPVCDLLDLYIHGVERYRGQWGWQALSIQGTGRRGYLSIY